MRYLITALLTIALVAPFAYSRITLLPSDDTAGGGAGDIYFSQNFGASRASAWVVTDTCLRVSGSATQYATCALDGDNSVHCNAAYSGTPYIRKLTCSPIDDPAAWNGTGTGATIDLGLYEVKGGGTLGGFVRTQVGSSLQFTEADGLRVSKTVNINSFVANADGALQVCVPADDQDGATTVDNGFNCTVSGVE